MKILRGKLSYQNSMRVGTSLIYYESIPEYPFIWQPGRQVRKLDKQYANLLASNVFCDYESRSLKHTEIQGNKI